MHGAHQFQIFRLDHVVAANDQRIVDHVFQFADIARPFIGEQGFLCLRRESGFSWFKRLR